MHLVAKSPWSDAASRRQHAAERRLHRAMEFLEAHLEEPLVLARLSRVAHLSPFHFHRLFRTLTGETPARYVTRRRIERAATALSIDQSAGILQVALSVGFGSAEAFSRAFKRRFGTAPTRWRNSQSPWRPTRDAGHHAVRIQLRPAVRIAYMRYEGPFGAPARHFWPARVVPWIKAARLGQAARFGIVRDDPHVTNGERCRYDAAVAVKPDYVPPVGVHLGEVAGGLYAVVPFSGPSTRLPQAWRELVALHARLNHYELDHRPPFEAYAPGYRPTPGRDWLECDLCLPIRHRFPRL